MIYVAGSAVDICCEIEQELVLSTTITLESLIDPDGNEILSSEAMEYDDDQTNLAFTVWQSTNGVDPVGRYEYIVKALNGTIENFSRGEFYLEER